MAEPRFGIAAELRRGPVWFIVRGEPGLGRLMESVSLARLICEESSPPRTRFFTSAAAVPLARRLLRRRVSAFDLERGGDLQQTLIDSRALQSLLESLHRGRPRAVVVDGYPILLPLLREVSDARLVAMANLHDLHNPAHSAGARRLQVALHTAADLVVISELRSNWRLGSLRGVPELRLPALVRSEASAPFKLEGAGAGVVAVLGGGSRGDSQMKASTREILRGLDAAAARREISGCRVFDGGADTDHMAFPHLEFDNDPANCLANIRAASVVVARAGRSTLAEILALRKRAVVVAALSDTLRGAEQASNAARAAALSPAVVVLPLASMDGLGAACVRAGEGEPPAWRPGNEMLWMAIDAADSQHRVS